MLLIFVLLSGLTICARGRSYFIARLLLLTLNLVKFIIEPEKKEIIKYGSLEEPKLLHELTN